MTNIDLAVVKTIFDFVLGPPSPRGVPDVTKPFRLIGFKNLRVTNIDLAVVETIVDSVLGPPPSPRGVPGQGPDCQFPEEIMASGADAGPDPGCNVF